MAPSSTVRWPCIPRKTNEIPDEDKSPGLNERLAMRNRPDLPLSLFNQSPRHSRRYSWLRERLTGTRASRHLPMHRHNALMYRLPCVECAKDSGAAA